MKKMKIQIVLVFALLGQGLSMQGMLHQLYQGAGKRPGLLLRPVGGSLTTPGRSFTNRPKSEVSTGWNWNWFKSWLSSAPTPTKATVSRVGASTPFSRVQTRHFSTIPEQSSLVKRFKPYLPWWALLSKPEGTLSEEILGYRKGDLAFELRSKGLEGIMHGLLYPKHTTKEVDRRGAIYDMRSFNASDLQKAKDTIGSIIELDENYKTSIVRKLNVEENPFSRDNLRGEESLFNTVLFDWNYRFEGTILDEVMYKIFSGESANQFSTTVDNELNYIKLAEWLKDKGLTINPDNEKNFMIGYRECLMRYNKEVYEPRSYGRKIIDENQFKKIFAALDPLMEKLILEPGLKEKLHQAQRERREIEANPQKYREKLQEEEYQKEYISQKRDRLMWDYIKRTGDWSLSSFDSQVNFDELEYQEWKKRGRFFESASEPKDEQNAGSAEYNLKKEQLIKELNVLLPDAQLSPDAPSQKIVKTFYDYLKEEHPDIAKQGIKETKEEKEKRGEKVGEFMGRYDDFIKTLKKEAAKKAAGEKEQAELQM